MTRCKSRCIIQCAESYLGVPGCNMLWLVATRVSALPSGVKSLLALAVAPPGRNVNVLIMSSPLLSNLSTWDNLINTVAELKSRQFFFFFRYIHGFHWRATGTRSLIPKAMNYHD